MSVSPNRRQFLAQAVTATSVALAGATAAGAGAPVPGPSQPATLSASAGPSGGEVPLAPPDKQPANLEVPEPVNRKIGWAVVGLGQLALEEIMPAFASCRYSEPVALVSGHPEKAKKVAKVYGIDPGSIYDYENYDKLGENEKVDVIYIVLPNNMHAEYTIRGLKAGKHVLCEKPMATTVAEAEAMISVAAETRKKLMIAYRLHYEPLNKKVMQWCKEKKFGRITTFASSNCQDVKAPNIRLSAKLGGGPLGDVGVYSINAARYTIGEEPEEVFAYSHSPSDDPRFREVPESVTYVLKYPSGVMAHCDCSFGSAESRRYRVHFTKGFIEMDPAFSYRGLRLRVKEGSGSAGGATFSDVLLEQVNHFTEEMEAFSKNILEDGDPATPGAMGLADMRIVEALQKSLATGQPVRVTA